MKPLNTIPIEDFLDRVRVAIKSQQKTVTLTIKEATDLQNSLSLVMTRLAGTAPPQQSVDLGEIKINMDGGKF